MIVCNVWPCLVIWHMTYCLSHTIRYSASLYITAHWTTPCYSITGVLGKKTLLRRRQHLGNLVKQTPNQGLESSLCCCVARQRFALNKRSVVFSPTPVWHIIILRLDNSSGHSGPPRVPVRLFPKSARVGFNWAARMGRFARGSPSHTEQRAGRCMLCTHVNMHSYLSLSLSLFLHMHICIYIYIYIYICICI